MKTKTLIFAAVAMTGFAAAAFPCRSDYGALEIAEIDGLVFGDSIVRKNIQRSKKVIGGQSGRVVCVLVPEGETGADGGFSKMISLSETSITNKISQEDFNAIAKSSGEQVAALEGQVINGFTFGDFHRGEGYYCNTMEVLQGSTAAAFTVMGGAYVAGHLFSFVAHTATLDPEEQKQWTATAQAWIRETAAANKTRVQNGNAGPVIGSVASIDDFKLLSISLGKSERVRTRDKANPDVPDVKFEYPKMMTACSAVAGLKPQFGTEIDDYELLIGLGVTRLDEGLDAEFDRFYEADNDAAAALAGGLADRLAAAAGCGNAAFASGMMEIGGRNGVWRDSWEGAAPGAGGSGYATKSLWVQMAGGRALMLKFMLRDLKTDIIPAADLGHFNTMMVKVIHSLSFQDKKQLKR